MNRRLLTSVVCVGLALGCGPASEPETSGGSLADSRAEELVWTFIERTFETYPTRAVAAGRHDFDSELEDLSVDRLAAWIAFNRQTLEALEEIGSAPDLGLEARLDLELVERRARLTLFDLEVLDRASTSPLWWTRVIGNATVFLLVREDAPLEQRLNGALSRARLLSRLTAQAAEALSGSEARVAPEIATMAARQVRASARFYGEGFPQAAGDSLPELGRELAEAGESAAAALTRLADFLDGLAATADGSPRLGELYAERFRLATGVSADVADVLAGAEAALAAKRDETAAYGRDVWDEVMGPGEAIPEADADVVRRLFERIGDDHAATVDEFVADYESLLAESVEFVRSHDLITLPEPLTVRTSRSPSFFVGQSVGGVYPAGPYSTSEAKTLFFLPTPSDSATDEQREGFFRDFNHHFNVMITPHEMVPGHYLQLKMAARHPRKVRALFGDGVYIEGWGTFCERLMLDEGWGDSADRLAHLKKQLENISRTIVDIRVHTSEISRDEVIEFVRTEAFQEAQFASNMWTRAITSSPQLTSYYLGYSQVRGLYDDVREARGDDFQLKEFMDGMMEMGPVPVARYRERLLGGSQP